MYRFLIVASLLLICCGTYKTIVTSKGVDEDGNLIMWFESDKYKFKTILDSNQWLPLNIMDTAYIDKKTYKPN